MQVHFTELTIGVYRMSLILEPRLARSGTAAVTVGIGDQARVLLYRPTAVKLVHALSTAYQVCSLGNERQQGHTQRTR